MTREVRFHPLATAEVVEAQLWYEDRGDALGFRFLDADVLGSSRGVRTLTDVSDDATSPPLINSCKGFKH